MDICMEEVSVQLPVHQHRSGHTPYGGGSDLAAVGTLGPVPACAALCSLFF